MLKRYNLPACPVETALMMSSRNKMKSSTADYWDNVQKATECIANAEKLLIGVDAGLSASGGLNYADFFQ
jgi:hypothetical protein